MQMADGNACDSANQQMEPHLYTSIGSNELVLCVSAPKAKSGKV